LRRSARSRASASRHRDIRYSLLRGLAIERRPNQVWCADITYIPIGRGFLCLVAIRDWASRAVLAWRLTNTMDSSFCISALEEALARFGRPEIFNTDQGSQFTSAAFTGMLIAAGLRISMDGRGRWMDNVFIERLWRSLKHEDIYLKGYADGREAHRGIAAWFAFYNDESYCPSLYVIDSKRVDCGYFGPVGYDRRLRTRSTRHLASSRSRIARLKSQGPSASGWVASISPRSAATRNVFGLMPRRAAACVRFIHPSASQVSGR
jgi:hypothetical protein